jgi:hypothetical protein
MENGFILRIVFTTKFIFQYEGGKIMTMRRFFATMLVLVVLLTAIAGACAEANKHSRFDNPGKGHDWDWVDLGDSDPYQNKNVNDNENYSENGYRNHLPLGEVILL